MRVTKIIREYIEQEVNTKYREKLNSIPNEYQEEYDRLIDEIAEIAKQANEKAKEVARKYDMLQSEDYTIIDYHTYRLGNESRREERRSIEDNLRKEKNRKIGQIILDLELGETTKKELNDILSKIEF